MEITNDIKIKVSSQYLGQDALTPDGRLRLVRVSELGSEEQRLQFLKPGMSITNGYAFSETKILLKCIQKLTDQDAIQVAKITGYEDFKIVVRDDTGNFLFICRETNGIKKPYPIGDSINLSLYDECLFWSNNEEYYSESSEVSLHCYQYLQSKGYALPYLEYSVDDLVKAGIYQLEG